MTFTLTRTDPGFIERVAFNLKGSLAGLDTDSPRADQAPTAYGTVAVTHSGARFLGESTASRHLDAATSAPSSPMCCVSIDRESPVRSTLQRASGF